MDICTHTHIASSMHTLRNVCSDILESFDEERVKLLSFLAQNDNDDDSDSSDSNNFLCRSNRFVKSSDDDSSMNSGNGSVISRQKKTKEEEELNKVEENRPPCDPDTQKGELERKLASQPHEWVFTVYDFDGKGAITREDINSLVRSMCEVLGKVSLPVNRTGIETETVGSLSVKLSVVKGPEIKTPNKPVEIKPISQVNEKRPMDRSLKRRRKTRQVPKMTSISNGKCNCGHCQHYVNLSDLESCCCSTSHQYHQNELAIHLRHCDRHCSCIDRNSNQKHRHRVEKSVCCVDERPPVRTSSPRREQRTTTRPISTHSTFGSTECELIAGSPCTSGNRNKDGEQRRTMRFVRNWVLKDSAMSIGRKCHQFPPLSTNNCCRHVHEHHHYIHQAYI